MAELEKNKASNPYSLKGLDIKNRGKLARAFLGAQQDSDPWTDETKPDPRDLRWSYTILSALSIQSDGMEVRTLTDEEKEIWQGAIAIATEAGLFLSPYLSMLRPAYGVSAGAGLKIDDEYRILIGPWFFDKEAKPYRSTLVLHEVLHPLLGHKRKQLLSSAAMIAGDCQINQGLRWNPDLEWPRNTDWTVQALFPETVKTPSYPDGLPDKRNFEWYYHEILMTIDPNAIMQSDDGQGDDASSEIMGLLSDDGQGNGNKTDSKNANDNSAGQSSDDDVDGLEYDQRGTCGGGVSDLEEKMLDGAGIKEAGDSEFHYAKQRSEALESADRRAGIGRGQGQWFDWLHNSLQPPVIPWSRTLSRVAKTIVDNAMEAGAEEKSPRRADRREYDYDPTLIRHGWIDPTIAIAWVLDVSGSMSSEMNTAISELEGALKAMPSTKLTLVTADDGVEGVQEIDSVKQINHDSTGGGGTRLAPAIGWCAMNLTDPAPNLVIVTTDGFLENSDWASIEDEITSGVLKHSSFLFVITGDNALPQSILRRKNVDAWAVREDGHAEHIR